MLWDYNRWASWLVPSTVHAFTPPGPAKRTYARSC